MQVDDAWCAAFGRDAPPPHAGLQRKPTPIPQLEVLPLKRYASKLEALRPELIHFVLSARWPNDCLHELVVAAKVSQGKGCACFVAGHLCLRTPRGRAASIH